MNKKVIVIARRDVNTTPLDTVIADSFKEAYATLVADRFPDYPWSISEVRDNYVGYVYDDDDNIVACHEMRVVGLRQVTAVAN